MTLPDDSPVARVIGLTRRLAAILEDEARLIRQARTRDLAGLQTDKMRLIDQYTEAMATLRRNPELVTRADRREAAALKAATTEFQAVLRNHSILVNAAKTATEGLVRAVADEVSKRANPVTGYSTDATIQTVGRKRPTSLAVNEVV